MSSSARPEQGPRPARRPRTLKARSNVTLRWLHTYTSMISLLLLLFFSVTGITLNHPDWAFGNAQTEQEVSGTLPEGWIRGQEVNWLTVAETLRADQGLRGRAADPRVDGQEATITFLAPGYSADTVIDTQTGQYRTRILAQGAVAVLNDLHKGRDSGGVWRVLLDISAAFLVVVALTGLGILLYLNKTRVQALTVMGLASLLVALFGWLAVR